MSCAAGVRLCDPNPVRTQTATTSLNVALTSQSVVLHSQRRPSSWNVPHSLGQRDIYSWSHAARTRVCWSSAPGRCWVSLPCVIFPRFPQCPPEGRCLSSLRLSMSTTALNILAVSRAGQQGEAWSPWTGTPVFSPEEEPCSPKGSLPPSDLRSSHCATKEWT